MAFKLFKNGDELYDDSQELQDVLGGNSYRQ